MNTLPKLSPSRTLLLLAAVSCVFLESPLLRVEVTNAAEVEAPKRLRRADSFLGIHFDFHAGPDCKEIGRNTTPAMVENIIDLVHPDYLQVDCKGHRGLTSYPTKAGNPAPGFVGDPLRVWRDVTARRGVALYMHYSGVWDSEAILQHPDWAAINADGKTNGNATSFFGRYADELLIPQLRELGSVYGVDGAWVDGECWASVPDYGAAALAAFRQATGITDVPRRPADPHWFEFLQFNRDAFRGYLRHYIAEVKKSCPEIQLCSNWAFTDHMPEPVTVPVDFLSGDYSPEDSVNSARLSARYLARQGKPWDLMAWSFTLKPGRGGGKHKTAVQLEREAAVVLALGGGFQAYHSQKRDGSIVPEQMPAMAEVAKFCRERQTICHHAVQVPQVALLYSTADHYRRINGLFSRDLARLSGTLQALLESQLSVEVLGEHHLAGRMPEYPLIIVPECRYLEPQFVRELEAYVREGGNLLLIGPQAAALFQSQLDVVLEGKPATERRYLAAQNSFLATKGEVQAVRLGASAQARGLLYLQNAATAPSQPAASVTTLGRGKIATTYFAFGQGYLEKPAEESRAFLRELCHELFPQPLATVSGSSDVDVVINRIGSKLAVNLVNTAGPHRTEPILDSIPTIGPLSVAIRASAKPVRVTLQPGGSELPYTFKDGLIETAVPQVKIHDIVVVE